MYEKERKSSDEGNFFASVLVGTKGRKGDKGTTLHTGVCVSIVFFKYVVT